MWQTPSTKSYILAFAWCIMLYDLYSTKFLLKWKFSCEQFFIIRLSNTGNYYYVTGAIYQVKIIVKQHFYEANWGGEVCEVFVILCYFNCSCWFCCEFFGFTAYSCFILNIIFSDKWWIEEVQGVLDIVTNYDETVDQTRNSSFFVYSRLAILGMSGSTSVFSERKSYVSCWTRLSTACITCTIFATRMAKSLLGLCTRRCTTTDFGR